MAKEVKKSNSKTNKTSTTVTVTVETKKEYAPSYKMPIDRGDYETEKFYRQDESVTVATVHGTGRQQTFAYIPDKDYENATDDEKEEIKKRADKFSRKVDNMRRTAARKYQNVIEHENVSMDGLLDAGYDPSIDSIDIAIRITNKAIEDEENKQFESEEDNTDDSVAEAPESYEDDDWSFCNKTKSRGGYYSDGDLNSPEYLVARKQLWDKLHELVDDLKGEEKAIIDMILEDKSVAKKAEELDVPKSTLNDHKNELFARLREALKDYR